MNKQIYIEEFKKHKQTIARIKFEDTRDPKYKKWFVAMENLIELAFPKGGQQMNQFRTLSRKVIDGDGINYGKLTVAESRVQFKDMIDAFIRLLELSSQSSVQAGKKRSGNSVSVRQTVSQNISVSVSLQSIIEHIEESEPDEARVQEAKDKISALQSELGKKKPKWSVVKDILIWALNFGRDVFLQLLPIILSKYTQ